MSLRSEVIRVLNELLASSKKITQLPAAGSITGSELVELVQSGVNVKATVSSLGGGGGGPTDLTDVWRGRPDYDASSNVFPTTNGTGVSGAIERYNTFRVIVAGTLGTIEPQSAPFNSILIAFEDAPGQDETKWRIL